MSNYSEATKAFWQHMAATFLGMLPVLLALSGVALSLIKDNERHDAEIKALQMTQLRIETQMLTVRGEVLSQMTRISSQIEELQKNVERIKR